MQKLEYHIEKQYIDRILVIDIGGWKNCCHVSKSRPRIKHLEIFLDLLWMLH